MELNVVVIAKTNIKDIPTGTIGAIFDFHSGGKPYCFTACKFYSKKTCVIQKVELPLRKK